MGMRSQVDGAAAASSMGSRYWPIFTPGSAHSSWIGVVGRFPGTFASRLYLNIGSTVRPNA